MNAPIVAVTMGLGSDRPRFRIGQAYVSAHEHAGALAIPLPHTPFTIERAETLIETMDGLLLAGGTDVDPVWYGEEPHGRHKPFDPDRDAFELALCRTARSRDLPILAICRGIQVLNVATGGTLYQDVSEQPAPALLHEQTAPRWHPTHDVAVVPGTALAEILGVESCRVNSFHHQTVRGIAAGFVCSAKASDGTIEAIEDPRARFTIGVQWHPEDLVQQSPFWTGLFEAFTAACGVARRPAG